jgi:ketosteroid isomerase-like protein
VLLGDANIREAGPLQASGIGHPVHRRDEVTWGCPSWQSHFQQGGNFVSDSTDALERNKATAIAYIEGIGRKDLEGIFQLLREDATFWQIGKRLELAGSHDMAELARLSQKATSKFPNGMRFDITTVTAEGNRVALEAESDAVLANGQPYNNQYVFFFYFDDEGKIIEFREYWDTLYAFETMFEGRTRL